MSELKLGQIITDEQNRDAIHIAVAPVFSSDTVFPGQHIGLLAGSTTEVTNKSATFIGIVDPYLKHMALPGQKFWMFLYPQTVTGLRHDWSHPAFADKTPAQKKR